jgi:hypothetical protein
VTLQLEAAGIDVENDIWHAGHPHMLFEGRAYGVLNNASVDCLWFHKDLFDEAGLPYPEGPWTWDEFIPLAKKLMVRDERGRVKRFGMMFEWWNWRHFMHQWGGRVYTEDGTRCILDCPGTVGAIQFMQDLIYKHRIAPSPVEEAAIATQGGWGSGTISFFGGQKTATAMGGRVLPPGLLEDCVGPTHGLLDPQKLARRGLDRGAERPPPADHAATPGGPERRGWVDVAEPVPGVRASHVRAEGAALASRVRLIFDSLFCGPQ